MFIKTGDGKITGIIRSKELTDEEKASVDEAVSPAKDKKTAPATPKTKKVAK